MALAAHRPDDELQLLGGETEGHLLRGSARLTSFGRVGHRVVGHIIVEVQKLALNPGSVRLLRARSRSLISSLWRSSPRFGVDADHLARAKPALLDDASWRRLPPSQLQSP